KADKAVLAAGAWSKHLADQLGEATPLETERGYHLMFSGVGHLLSRATYWRKGGFVMTPLGNDLRIAGTVELGGLHAPPTQRRIEILKKTVWQVLPDLAGKEPSSVWMGFRPSMPDSIPVIGASLHHPQQVFYAYGHGHLGFVLAALTGRIIEA